jgi:hypothetical protein
MAIRSLYCFLPGTELTFRGHTPRRRREIGTKKSALTFISA